MDSILLQKQIRDNAEELQDFANSLKNWEQEMKSKEEELLKLKTEETTDVKEKIFKNKEDKILKHEEADGYKKKGNSFVQQGKWKVAIKEYSKSIKLYPNDAAYYGNRSYCYMQLKKWEEAEEDCNKALELKPDYVKVALRRANVRKQRGNIQGAAKDYNLVLVLEPKNITALKEYEDIYPKLIKFYKNLGLELPDFIEMNPSAKTEKDDNLNIKIKDDIFSTRQKPRKKKKTGFPLVYPTTIKANKKVITEKTVDKNQQNVKINDSSIIEPALYKPPHLRSKLPLRRIPIEDVYLNSDDD